MVVTSSFSSIIESRMLTFVKNQWLLIIVQGTVCDPSEINQTNLTLHKLLKSGNEKIPKVKRPTVSLVTGLVCYDEGKRKCPDFSIRFCCPIEQNLECLLHKKPFIPVKPNPEWLPPDACCGERPYNTNQKVR